MQSPRSIRPATGRLAVLLPGLGAVATTTIAGVMLARRGLLPPIGSVTQLGTIRVGKRTEGRTPRIKDFLPLASLDDLVFGGADDPVAALVLAAPHRVDRLYVGGVPVVAGWSTITLSLLGPDTAPPTTAPAPAPTAAPTGPPTTAPATPRPRLRPATRRRC